VAGAVDSVSAIVIEVSMSTAERSRLYSMQRLSDDGEAPLLSPTVNP
jgi:hypothetical protein